MPDRIDLEQRRALLARRHLLGADGRAGRTLHEVVDALALLHSTDPVTPFLMIHARSVASPADVEAALYDDRSLERFTTIRRTVFAMDADAASSAQGAFNGPMVVKLRTQLEAWIEASGDVDEPAAEFLDRTAALVVDRLRSVGSSTGNELADAIPELRVRFDPKPGASYSRPMRITSKVLEILGAERRIARDRPTGADYTSAAWRWSAATGEGSTEPVDSAVSSLESLLRRYLTSFAPATVTDMTWWTGLTKTKVRAALVGLGAREVIVEGGPGEEPAFALGDDALDPGPSGDAVALLPGLDSTTMGWKQRGWYVDDRPDAGLFDRNGNAGPTIWAGGRVVGVWTQRPDGTIATEYVRSVGSVIADQVADESDRLAAWLGDVRVKWRYPTPITKRLSG